MPDVIVNNHDLLGKATIIKNCLSLLIENKGELPFAKITSLLKTAFSANEELIAKIKSSKPNLY